MVVEVYYKFMHVMDCFLCKCVDGKIKKKCQKCKGSNIRIFSDIDINTNMKLKLNIPVFCEKCSDFHHG